MVFVFNIRKEKLSKNEKYYFLNVWKKSKFYSFNRKLRKAMNQEMEKDRFFYWMQWQVENEKCNNIFQ